MTEILALDDIVSRIHNIRRQKVILDRDLAKLYEVETRVLKQAVRRNIKRFPPDFMFQLTKPELESLRSQSVTLKRGQHSKYPPFAFTEQGVAMLSSVLKSDRAIDVNIQIVRAFVKAREFILDNEKLRRQLEALRAHTDARFELVFEALDRLVSPEKKIEEKDWVLKG
jgi:phage regulator Rha-like protein